MIKVKMKKLDTDLVYSYSALIQPVLLLIQLFIGNAAIVSIETAATFRLITTAFFVLVGMFFLINRNPKKLLLTYIFAILLILYSGLLNPANWEYIKIDGVKFFLLTNIPTFLFISEVKSLESMKRVMLKIANVIFIIGCIYFIFQFTGKINAADYSMSLSFSLLFSTLVLFSQSSLIQLLKGVILLVIMFISGSRGAFIAAIFFLTLKFGLSRRIILSVVVVGVAVIFNIYLEKIQQLIFNLGFQARTVALLSSGELISHDSGRLDMYQTVWEKIIEAPLLGYGIYADRVFLDGTYSHNIFLEFCVNYGLVLGTLLMILLLCFAIYVFIRSKKRLLSALFISLIIPLFVSFSYLDNFFFGLFFGGLILMNKHNKKKNEYFFNNRL